MLPHFLTRMNTHLFVWGRPAALWLACLVALNGSAQDTNTAILKGPYLQGPGTNSMVIKWEAASSKPGVVHYGPGGAASFAVVVEFSRLLNAVVTQSVTNLTADGATNITRVNTTNLVYLFEADLTNLQPASVYTYSVAVNGQQTPPKEFRTFAVDQAKVTFIAYGDARSNPKTHRAVTANFKQYAPDFIMHTGDLVADGRRYELWEREFFAPLAGVIDEIPMLPSIGNHEQDGRLYQHYLTQSGQQLWYSYDIGPVHVVALDYRHEKANNEQYAFARADLLASKAPWKLVFLHYPVFNIGGHATGWGHGAYLPLFHEAKVDLVVVGHSHLYERFHPIAGSDAADSWPITHITTGGGGAPLYEVLPHPALATYYSTNHFMVFEATGSALKGRTFSTNNTLLDEFEIKKSHGQPSPDYLAQVYPEAALKLFYSVGPSLAASLASVPLTNASARARFTLQSVRKYVAALPLEITLAPEAEPFYELEDGPLRTTLPGANDPDKSVWGRVRARPGKKITVDARSGELLSPPLTFQGRIKVGAVESMVYGQRSRVTEDAAQAAKLLDGDK